TESDKAQLTPHQKKTIEKETELLERKFHTTECLALNTATHVIELATLRDAFKCFNEKGYIAEDKANSIVERLSTLIADTKGDEDERIRGTKEGVKESQSQNDVAHAFKIILATVRD